MFRTILGLALSLCVTVAADAGSRSRFVVNTIGGRQVLVDRFNGTARLIVSGAYPSLYPTAGYGTVATTTARTYTAKSTSASDQKILAQANAMTQAALENARQLQAVAYAEQLIKRVHQLEASVADRTVSPFQIPEIVGSLAGGTSTAQEQAAEPPHPGFLVLTSRCGKCHAGQKEETPRLFDTPTVLDIPEEQTPTYSVVADLVAKAPKILWQIATDKMPKAGEPLSPEEKAHILDYLRSLIKPES